MKALELALAFVFISNAVFLVAAGLVLYRILHHTRTAHEALVAAANETQDAGKQLRSLANSSHEQLNKVTAAAGSGGEVSGATLDKLTRLIQDLMAKQGGGDAPETLPPDQDGKAGKAGKDDRPHRSELDRALAHNHRLRASIEQLRLQLDEAHKTVADMRRDERIASTEAMENMRQLVTRLHGQLDAARKNTRDAEKRAKNLELELMDARDKIQQAQTPEELKALEQRLDHMQRENGALSGEVDELKQLIQRTLREKNFIEDRFIKLDSELAGQESTESSAEVSTSATATA